MALVNYRTVRVITVMPETVRTQNGIHRICWLIYQLLLGTEYLHPFQKSRTLVYHPQALVKDNARLMFVGGTAIDLRRIFKVPTG